VVLQSSALAATVGVSMTNFVFTPKTATVKQGNTVLWTNNTPGTNHTSTSDSTSPISWDSGSVPGGGTFLLPFALNAAGSYPYHCSFHFGLGMVGTLSVPVKASPGSGPIGTVFSIIVAQTNASGTFVYDIQKMNPGGSFVDWMVGVTAKSVNFDSTGLPAGTYQFRARLRDTSTGNATGYSKGKKVTVTP